MLPIFNLSSTIEWEYFLKWDRKENNISYWFWLFLCTVWRNKKTRVKKIPSVVCVYSGREEDSGVVSTCNYEARKYGVKAAMPIRMAKLKLKDVHSIFLPTDMPYYQEISTKAMRIIQNYGELFEQVSVDECYMDFTKITNSDFDDAKFLLYPYKRISRIRLNSRVQLG